MIKTQGRRSNSFVRLNFTCVIFAIIITVTVRITLLEPYKLPDYIKWSDYSLLTHGEKFILLRNYSFFSFLNKNDIVVTDPKALKNGLYKVGMIKAVPGDIISLKGKNELFINNKFLDLKDFILNFELTEGNFTVPDNQYMLLGQNFENKLALYVVSVKDIYGKALYSYYPFKDRRFINIK